MKILGNRILISKVEEDKKEGFQTVDVQDSFVYKGKVESRGNDYLNDSARIPEIEIGNIILFAKYSPDTQEVDYEGKKMKIVSADDVLAVL